MTPLTPEALANLERMPERQPFDGPISVRRIGESFIIEATQGAMTTRVEMSEYNAWRTFGCLALFLEIPLPPHVSKAIDLSDGKGNPPKATVGYPEPKTLGERLAQNLTMNELVRRGIVAGERDAAEASLLTARATESLLRGDNEKLTESAAECNKLRSSRDFYLDESKRIGGVARQLDAELAAERASRERLEASRQATLDILAEEFPKLGAEWRSCLAFVFGALGASEQHAQLQASEDVLKAEGAKAPPLPQPGAAGGPSGAGATKEARRAEFKQFAASVSIPDLTVLATKEAQPAKLSRVGTAYIEEPDGTVRGVGVIGVREAQPAEGATTCRCGHRFSLHTGLAGACSWAGCFCPQSLTVEPVAVEPKFRVGQPKEHILKTWPDAFLALEGGSKRFEYRKNDRQFQVGDVLVLQMYDPNFRGYSTGTQRDFSADHGATFGDYIKDANGKRREVRMRVTYVLTDGRLGVPAGFCIMSLEPADPAPSPEPSPEVPGLREEKRITCSFCLGSWPIVIDGLIAMIRSVVTESCICQHCALRAADIADEHTRKLADELAKKAGGGA